MATFDVRFSRNLQACEARFLQALSSGEDPGFADDCAALFLSATQALDREQISAATMSKLVSFAKCVSVVSTNLLRLDTASDEIKRDVAVRSRRLVSSPHSCEPFTPFSEPTLDDQAHCAPYREWFRANFTNPYPSAHDKDHLLTLVPRHTKTQLDTWFVNNRRRSGWAALRRAHTNGSVDAMRQLVDDVDAGIAGDAVARQVAKVREFFDDGMRDRVSDEIQAIVAKGAALSFGSAQPSRYSPPPPQQSSTQRCIEQRATRGVGAAPRARRSVTPPHPAPYARASDHSPYSTSPRSLSPLDVSGDAPRYPSTFSSPTESSRTTSSSSSRSFDSLVSYASVESAPVRQEDHPATSSYYAVDTDEAEGEIPPVPSSPPTTSSLLSFAGARHAALPLSSPFGGSAAGLSAHAAREAHPYFCTVDELPTSSPLIGFAGGLGM